MHKEFAISLNSEILTLIPKLRLMLMLVLIGACKYHRARAATHASWLRSETNKHTAKSQTTPKKRKACTYNNYDITNIENDNNDSHMVRNK